MHGTNMLKKYGIIFLVLLSDGSVRIRKHIPSIIINTLKPTGHVMHHQFNIQQLYVHCIYVFCIYLRTNSDLCHLQHKLIGFYNPDEKCLQRGTDWGFK